jgi:hypothetical protein
MKQTLKITISSTKPKGIAYKLRPKKCPTHLFTWRRKVGKRWGLSSKINQGIATQKLTKKKAPPIFSNKEDEWSD